MISPEFIILLFTWLYVIQKTKVYIPFQKGFSWSTQKNKNKFDNIIHWEATKR